MSECSWRCLVNEYQGAAISTRPRRKAMGAATLYDTEDV